MGAILAGELRGAVYAIAGSLGAALHGRGWREALMDPGRHGGGPCVMSGLEHAQERQAHRRRVFDGVYFVDRVEPVALQTPWRLKGL